MKLLVNGSSLSRGPGSWPYHLTDTLGCSLVNIACAAAGVNYTCNTTITELARRDYDFVIVQWPSFNRWDHKVKNPEKYKTLYSSMYQSEQNDWPSKVIFPINDQDYVEKDWLFGCGYVNNFRDDPEFVKIWEPYYGSISNQQMLQQMLVSIICLQSYLAAQKIPYLFFSNRPILKLEEHSALWNKIDIARFYQEVYLLDIAKDKNMYDEDQLHPSSDAHKEFADLLLPMIRKFYDC